MWRWTVGELLVTLAICLLAEQCSSPGGKEKGKAPSSLYSPHTRLCSPLCEPNQTSLSHFSIHLRIATIAIQVGFCFLLLYFFLPYLLFFLFNRAYLCYLLAFPFLPRLQLSKRKELIATYLPKQNIYVMHKSLRRKEIKHLERRVKNAPTGGKLLVDCWVSIKPLRPEHKKIAYKQPDSTTLTLIWKTKVLWAKCFMQTVFLKNHYWTFTAYILAFPLSIQ